MGNINNKPKWSNDAEQNLSSREEKLSQNGLLNEEIKHQQLMGIRVFVLINEKLGIVSPVQILYGKSYASYEEFMNAVESFRHDFFQQHYHPDLRLEDRWAADLEDFQKNNPDLAVKFS